MESGWVVVVVVGREEREERFNPEEERRVWRGARMIVIQRERES